jgi:hypothetical protein
MGANEEQIQLLVSEQVDHVSYVLVLYSVAFLVYLCIRSAFPANPSHYVLNLAVYG